MADVFISYGRSDQPLARALAEALDGRGWSVWWDRRLHAGIQFDREIERQIERARCVLVLWSRHSVGSDWVRAEATEGLRREILMPVALEPIEPPIMFRQTHTLALHGWDGRSDDPRLQELQAALELHVTSAARDRPAESWPEPEWIHVPAGAFHLLGELGVQSTLQPAFRISRFPVTRAQFAVFAGLAGTLDTDLPQVGVSWHEAAAYCRWLSKGLACEVALPSERQWERAARGDEPRPYPWGMEFLRGRCNSREAGLGRVSEVGRFGTGASVYGVEDLSGNVWEWCAPAQPNPSQISEPPGLCPVRGGSFDLPAALVSCTRRHFLPARLSAAFVGFRVVSPMV